MLTSIFIFLTFYTIGILSADNQAEAPGFQNQNKNVNVQNAKMVVGATEVIRTIPLARLGFNTPVGAVHDGNGNLFISDINTGEIFLVDLKTNTAELVISSINAIGLGTDGTNLFATVPSRGVISVFDIVSRTLIREFPSVGTGFPEGIAFDPSTGHLFVVDGGGGNKVIEYTVFGDVVQEFPILGSSPDGIVRDNNGKGFWIYDSGTRTIRFYTAGSFDHVPDLDIPTVSGGEGLAIIQGQLFLVRTQQDNIVTLNNPFFKLFLRNTMGAGAPPASPTFISKRNLRSSLSDSSDSSTSDSSDTSTSSSSSSSDSSSTSSENLNLFHVRIASIIKGEESTIVENLSASLTSFGIGVVFLESEYADNVAVRETTNGVFDIQISILRPNQEITLVFGFKRLNSAKVEIDGSNFNTESFDGSVLSAQLIRRGLKLVPQ